MRFCHAPLMSQNSQLLLSESEITNLLEENRKLKLLVEKQGNSIASKEVVISEKDLIIAKLSRMLFGQKRERFEHPDNQLDIFIPIPTEVKEDIQEEVAEKIEVTYTREKKAHPGRIKLPEDLEVVETTLEPAEDTKKMVLIGQEVTEELGYQPEKFFIHRIIRKKYAPKSGEGSFAIAELPDRVIPKGIPSAELVTQILVDKYIDHLPLYRIRQRFARNGIKVPNSTIDGWVKTCLDRLQILYEYTARITKNQDYLQVDETTIKVQDSKLKGKTHLGYYWVYRAPVDGSVLFEYHSSRAGKYVVNSLKDFKGYLQTDGYAGYNAIATREDITHLACMAHIRRKYDEALSNDKPRAEKALLYIQKLYAIERQAKDLTIEERKELRLTEALPIINEMGKWIAEENKKVLPKSAIGKAFRYSIVRWDEASNYLYNGNLEIDNNMIENAIRPIAIGRKNYLFAGSHEAAQRAAMIYTFFAQCKIANVNPSDWISYALLNILHTKPSQYESLLPANYGKKL